MSTNSVRVLHVRTSRQLTEQELDILCSKIFEDITVVAPDLEYQNVADYGQADADEMDTASYEEAVNDKD